MLQLTTKLMNRFNYSITTPFIPGNKYYHSYCNPHLVYQTYPKSAKIVSKIDVNTKIGSLFYSTKPYGAKVTYNRFLELCMVNMSLAQISLICY